MYSSKNDNSNWQELRTYHLPILMTTAFVRYYYLLDIIIIPFLYDENDAQKG